MAQVLVHASSHPHSHPCVRLDRLFSPFFPHLVPFCVFLLSLLLLPEPGPVPLPLPCGLHRGHILLALCQMRSLAFWPITRLSQIMSPTSLTFFTTQRLLKSRSPPATPGPRTCITQRSVTTPSAERSLHHCSFWSEKNQRTLDKLITLLKKSLLPSQSLSVCHVRTVRPVYELSSLGSSSREKPGRDSENEQFRILLERHKEQILADCRAEIQKHEFQADSDRRSIQELSGIIGSQRREIDHTLARDEQLRRDQLLLHEQLLEQNRDLREAHMKSLNEMEELKRFQWSTLNEFSRRRLIEYRDTILQLTARIQELQNEVNCMNHSRDFKDAESARSGLSHVATQPVFSHLFEIQSEC